MTATPHHPQPDEELEREIREDVAETALWMNSERLDVSVERGVVELVGEVEHRADAELLERFTAAVPGVVSVRSDLRWRFDEPKLPAGERVSRRRRVNSRLGTATRRVPARGARAEVGGRLEK